MSAATLSKRWATPVSKQDGACGGVLPHQVRGVVARAQKQFRLDMSQQEQPLLLNH